MPKVFRPKIVHPSVNSQEPKPTEPVISSPVKRTRSPSPVPIEVQPEELETSGKTASSQPEAKKLESFYPTSSIAHVDIDNTAPVKTALSSAFEPIDLFSYKRPRRLTQKPNFDPPPAADKPLDRSKVSLRALLKWTPAGKPPPKYRQDRPEGGKRSPNDKDDELNQPTQPDIKCKPSLPSPVRVEFPRASPSSKHVDILAPQVCLDSDGNIVLDESSLYVRLPEVSPTDAGIRHVTEEAGVLGVTYKSFRPVKPKSTGPWSTQETVRFYRALSTVGNDFYLMLKLFPNRTRDELRRKFRRENRRHSYLVDQALRDRRTFDLSSLVPLSDEEAEVKPSNKKGTDSQAERSTAQKVKSEPDEVKPKRRSKGVRRRTNAVTPSNPAPRKRQTRKRKSTGPSQSSNMDLLTQTIDIVLSEGGMLTPPPPTRNPLERMIEQKRAEVASMRPPSVAEVIGASEQRGEDDDEEEGVGVEALNSLFVDSLPLLEGDLPEDFPDNFDDLERGTQLEIITLTNPGDEEWM